MRFVPAPNLERALKPVAALQRKAEEAARLANTFVGHPFMPRGGRKTTPVIVETDGEQVRVVNTDYGAAIQEYGSAQKSTPARAPLRRGVSGAGLRFKDTGQ